MNPFLPEFCFYLSPPLLPLPPSTTKVTHHFILPRVVKCALLFALLRYVGSRKCASFTSRLSPALLWLQMIVSFILHKRRLPSIASSLPRTKIKGKKCTVGAPIFNFSTAKLQSFPTHLGEGYALPTHLRRFSRLFMMVGNGSCIKQGQNINLNFLSCLPFFYLSVCTTNHRLTKSRD